jgi:hypothetical protein
MVEKKMSDKINKSIFSEASIFLLAIVLAFVLPVFVMATGAIVKNYTFGGTFEIDEDTQQNVINISVNNTYIYNNITQVNITLPSGFTFIDAATNGTSSINTAQFQNTTTVLSWENLTEGLVANGSGINWTFFYFNVSAVNPGIYNLNITTLNGSAISNSTNLSIIVNDTTAPEVLDSNFTLVSGGNYSGTITLNVTIGNPGATTDPGRVAVSPIEVVTFNVTNLTRDTMFNMTATNDTLLYWNASLDTTALADGNYNISVVVNDSAMRSNTTAYLGNITIDNTAPSAVTVTSSSTTKTSLTLSVATTEATSGVNDCRTDRSGATITGTGAASQTLTETGLSCGTTYTYLVTCYDFAGNSKTSSETSFTTTTCGGGADYSGSGGGSPTTWTNTYAYDDKELSQGSVEKELGVKQRVKLKVSGSKHYVGVKEVKETTVKVEVTSTPQEATLSVGDSRKFDVDTDGTYDLLITLKGIANGKADLTMESISEAVTEDAQQTEQEKEAAAKKEAGEDVDEGGMPTVGIVILIILILAAIGGGIAVKSRK